MKRRYHTPRETKRSPRDADQSREGERTQGQLDDAEAAQAVPDAPEGEEMVSVRCLIPGKGTLSVLVPQAGIPALRLLQHHAPNLGIECLDHRGNQVTVTLVNLDLSHEALRVMNAGQG